MTFFLCFFLFFSSFFVLLSGVQNTLSLLGVLGHGFRNYIIIPVIVMGERLNSQETYQYITNRQIQGQIQVRSKDNAQIQRFFYMDIYQSCDYIVAL